MEIRRWHLSRSMYALFTKTLEHSMLSFFIILGSLNEIWATFDIVSPRCYNKRQDRKLRPVWRQSTLRKRVKFAHNWIAFTENVSRWTHCSFSLCSPMKYTFSFQRASWAEIAELDARTSQVDQFAVVAARPKLVTWSIAGFQCHAIQYRSK